MVDLKNSRVNLTFKENDNINNCLDILASQKDEVTLNFSKIRRAMWANDSSKERRAYILINDFFVQPKFDQS